MKIVFMGTPSFAKDSLEAIYNAGHEILAVVTNPDKPKGRGMKMVCSPVKEYALEKDLKIYQPIKVRNNYEFINEIKLFAPDVICVVAYGKILPKEILDIPKKGCINVHGSILPKYRGAAPIQWAVINGETKTGITTMYMDEGMDTGDMILQKEVEIGEHETTGELWDRLSKIGGELLVETLDKIEKNVAPRIPQTGDFSMAPMLTKEISKIDWNNKSIKEIYNLIRGLNPIMGAYSILNGKKLKFWKAEIIDKDDLNIENIEISNKENGQIILSNCKKGLFIKGKDGIISILEIQGENSKKMSILDFLRGNQLKENEIFE